MSEDGANEPGAGLAATESAADAPTRIAGPMPCVKCLYDLAGLTEDQKCPECGTDVARTLASPAAASVVELLRLRRGLRLIAVPMIAGTTWLLLAEFAIVWLAFRVTATSLSGMLMGVVEYIVPLVSAGFCLMSAFGWTQATKSAVALIPKFAGRSRTVTRLAWAYSTMMVMMLFGSVLANHLVSGDIEFVFLGLPMGAATLVIWLIRTVLGFGLLGSIARLCCSPRTAWFLIVIPWVAVILAVVVGGAVALEQWRSFDSRHTFYLEYLAPLCGLGLAVVIIGLGVSAAQLRRRLAPFARGAVTRDAA